MWSGDRPRRAQRVRWLTAFLDTPRDAGDASTFWQQVTGTTASEPRGRNREFATLLPADGDPFVRTQDVDTGDPRCHLDIHVDDVRAELARAVDLGATAARDDGTLAVLISPGGFTFCLVAHHGERIRPTPVAWPGGHHSAVDQLCFDVPPELFDPEAAFWSALTEWPRRQSTLPEFEYLRRPAGMPLRLLLQKLDAAPRAAPVRAHLDLACDDIDAEARRHEELGATFVRRGSWVTLRDPAGREYCVTARNPFTGD